MLTKLGCSIEEELKSLGVEGEIVFIRDKLQSMSAFLRVADAIKDTDPEIQAWIKQVREVAYDTDDVFDEFMLRFAHRRYHHRGFYGSVCKIYYQIKNMKARHQIASDIQDIKARVIDIAQSVRGMVTNSIPLSKPQAPMWRTMEDVMIEKVMHFYLKKMISLVPEVGFGVCGVSPDVFPMLSGTKGPIKFGSILPFSPLLLSIDRCSTPSPTSM
ncbi:Disease resistance protein PIK6-NP [Camellia lanceoleosa]|uniref:Disease resistance protein PIK6-NP n=1 Tax=Camellia lanceoleosa TaxID=1840588 RepID=A0ACC0F1G3_9ERIC|nr:Disease resistance protein PIK6-NP [Camellia lanceoleosa]